MVRIKKNGYQAVCLAEVDILMMLKYKGSGRETLENKA